MSRSGSDRKTEREARPRPDASAADSEAEPVEESRIIIRPDGEVVIENLSALLAEVAEELDPEVELACAVEPSSDPGEDATDETQPPPLGD